MQNSTSETLKSDRKYDAIFNIGLDSTSREKVLTLIRDSLTRKRKFSILTPNPEIILASKEDKNLAEAINKATLAIPDGIGLSQAARFLSLPAPKNILLRSVVCLFQGLWVGLATFLNRKWVEGVLPTLKGRELFLDLVKLANKKGWKVFFLGGKEDEARIAGEKLRRSLKRVQIAYAAGPLLSDEANPLTQGEKEAEKEVVREINEFKPQMLFVGFGAPRQEKWLIKRLDSLEIGGGMVVGGTFRYISGQAKLPPKWMEKFGLEWIWRLMSEPWRIRRVINATILFPWKILLSKLAIL